MSYRFDTLAIHSGQPNDEATGSVTVPIYQSSTYQQLEPGVHRGFGYSRTEHPTRRALEENLAALEGASYGLAFASGMAAIHNSFASAHRRSRHHDSGPVRRRMADLHTLVRQVRNRLHLRRYQ